MYIVESHVIKYSYCTGHIYFRPMNNNNLIFPRVHNIAYLLDISSVITGNYTAIIMWWLERLISQYILPLKSFTEHHSVRHTVQRLTFFMFFVDVIALNNINYSITVRNSPHNWKFSHNLRLKKFTNHCCAWIFHILVFLLKPVILYHSVLKYLLSKWQTNSFLTLTILSHSARILIAFPQKISRIHSWR